ncbi:molybdopterin converting factor, large subunit [Corynebacterium glutamicum MT]|uniref:Molybdopterin converting factor n=1 Tax=Corynebacterium glutamicum TaxID=1718 RepID=A0AB36I9V8_CORGT|nr:molybdenum cofactor biosynthesis protein MoaE [Corynebacterium glutamicum]AGN17869.1 molybdopterin synthase, large subunit [Corynebacterium glutamicum SCgG1]AGN20892.1 molybdopterin synthase, large subunit [Corynebacterium glutamicum SCgG2]EGV39677.1 molybdopterin synthase, large subunit [Corynebacterium glutamicum S9114]EOA64978.1 molybdopterin converting factor, large subunit [Corynebacterium glutamicum MT]EPP42003.1 molybdopterin synthase, large subunit [Corynebacterium glutamicum Z188]
MNTDPAYVAEQTGKLIDAFLTTDPLEPLLDAAKNDVCTETMGALVTFEGIVRDHDGGARVTSLTYTAHPTAPQVLSAVTDSIVEKHPRTRLWTAHRTGALKIGDAAFLVVAASAHRADAFAACSDLADAVKAQVPIWKEQTRLDGSTDWVGL